MANASITTATIGFPRIGPNREMKKALERFALSLAVFFDGCPAFDAGDVLTNFAVLVVTQHLCAMQFLEEAIEFRRAAQGERPD